MKFLVVVPSIRQSLAGFQGVMDKIQASFTQPTDFRILDGKEGKAQTLNRVLNTILKPGDYDVYVTMDDDYIPAPGWQDALVKGFEAIPDAGALGIWLGDDPEMQAYMMAEVSVLPPEKIGDVTVRRLHAGNIPGAMLAFRKQVALKIGPTPVGGERYQVYEDGYRCGCATNLGYCLAYIEMEPVPTIIHYQDTAEYHAIREADIASAKEKTAGYLSQMDKRLPPLERIRRGLRRVAGKVKRTLLGSR